MDRQGGDAPLLEARDVSLRFGGIWALSDVSFSVDQGELFSIIQRINRDQQITILLVQQNARLALMAANYGYIMESGKVVLDGTAEELLNNEDVKEFYLDKGGEGSERKSVRNLKSFKRRKRWL